MNKKQAMILIGDLCSQLDIRVYLPVKQELTQPHSLGMRKEDFKSYIEQRILKEVK